MKASPPRAGFGAISGTGKCGQKLALSLKLLEKYLGFQYKFRFLVVAATEGGDGGGAKGSSVARFSWQASQRTPYWSDDVYVTARF